MTPRYRNSPQGKGRLQILRLQQAASKAEHARRHGRCGGRDASLPLEDPEQHAARQQGGCDLFLAGHRAVGRVHVLRMRSIQLGMGVSAVEQADAGVTDAQGEDEPGQRRQQPSSPAYRRQDLRRQHALQRVGKDAARGKGRRGDGKTHEGSHEQAAAAVAVRVIPHGVGQALRQRSAQHRLRRRAGNEGRKQQTHRKQGQRDAFKIRAEQPDDAPGDPGEQAGALHRLRHAAGPDDQPHGTGSIPRHRLRVGNLAQHDPQDREACGGHPVGEHTPGPERDGAEHGAQDAHALRLHARQRGHQAEQQEQADADPCRDAFLCFRCLRPILHARNRSRRLCGSSPGTAAWRRACAALSRSLLPS